MANVTIPLRVQHKYMTKNEWEESPLILLLGEIGVESDTGMLKVGDGQSVYSQLKYLTGPAGKSARIFTSRDYPDHNRVPNPQENDMFIYSTTNGVIFVHNGTEWVWKGNIKGPKGDSGASSIDQIPGLQEKLDNIGKILIDGKYLTVQVVDKGAVPEDTTGLLVFERKE